MDCLKDIIIRIKQAREKAHLSARELSLQIGKNSTYITKLEAGEFNITMQTIIDIVNACGITLEEFFYRNQLAYSKDKELLDFFNTLSDRQQEAILNLYRD